MSAKSGKSLRAGGTPQTVNVLNINGNLFSLGDLRKADFSSLEEPKCSVKSLQAWAIQLTRILKGVSPEQPTDSESLARAAGVTPTGTTTHTEIVTSLNNKGASISLSTGTIQDCLNAL